MATDCERSVRGFSGVGSRTCAGFGVGAAGSVSVVRSEIVDGGSEIVGGGSGIVGGGSESVDGGFWRSGASEGSVSVDEGWANGAGEEGCD